MALTINAQILGQDVSSTCSYCYLYEPLVVAIDESDLSATKMFVDIEIVDTSNINIILNTLVEYGEYDINSGQLLSIDLMELAKQHHDAELFKFSHIDDIILNGQSSIVSKYRYRFKIYSDTTTTPTEVFKLPIIGGRLFKDFEPSVTESNLLTEAEVAGITLTDRWCNYDTILAVLSDPTQVNSKPIITSTRTPIDNTNTFYVGVDESESSSVAVDEAEQTENIGI